MSSGSLTSHGFIYIKFKNRQNVYMLLEVRRGICLEGGSRMCSVCEDASSCTIMICLFFYMYVIVLKKSHANLLTWFESANSMVQSPGAKEPGHISCDLSSCWLFFSHTGLPIPTRAFLPPWDFHICWKVYIFTLLSAIPDTANY